MYVLLVSDDCTRDNSTDRSISVIAVNSGEWVSAAVAYIGSEFCQSLLHTVEMKSTKDTRIKIHQIS